MSDRLFSNTSVLLITAVLVISACSSPKELQFESGSENFRPSDADPSAIISKLPDYRQSLLTVEGKGKALVSETGRSSERFTVFFSGNRKKSRLTIKNGIGIEGAKILSDGDSLLIYNKIDHYARHIAINKYSLTSIDNLASVNVLRVLNFTAPVSEVKKILEDNKYYLLQLNSGTRIYVDKQSSHVMKITQPPASASAYSKIIYDGYDEIEGFILPRRITIFSSDTKTRVSLLIQALKVNVKLQELTIELPDNITVYYQ